MKTYRNMITVATAVAALTIAAQARADTMSFFLTTQETGPLLAQSSAVEVTVQTTSSTTAIVTFRPPNGTTNVVPPVEINVNGAFEAISTEGLAPTSPCFGNGASGTACAPGGGGAATFGTMSLETGSSNHPSVTIDLIAENGNSFADAAAVLTPDSKGFEAVVTNGTGDQDGGSLSATPLPAAFPLFASGLGALGLLGWRRKRTARSVAI
jgi:hypothetical protein